MLYQPIGVGVQAYSPSPLDGSFRQAARALGISTPKLCLDAGDASSFTSGQSWLDQSGNGYDFFLGDTSSSEATDPTFNGTAGLKSPTEYFSYDGGDSFTYDSANETWMKNLHKDNALATFIAWIYVTDRTSVQGIIGNRGGNTGGNTGADFSLNVTTGRLLWRQRNGSAVQTMGPSTVGVGVNAWHMAAVSVNEAAGAAASVFAVDGTTETFDATYTSPTASDPTFTTQIGSLGNGVNRLLSGTRMAGLLAWDTNLSAAQIVAFFNTTRGRFGV